jgi:hypothetical protein
VRIASYRILPTAILIVTALCAAWAAGDDPAENTSVDPTTVQVARDRAQLLHRVYASTLDVMHDHYFQANRAVLPARAMEDVFSRIADEAKIEARWISVNTPPMSVSHAPRTEFEKQAAEVLDSGKPFYERIEQGVYSRAAPIPLSGGCVNCHMGFFKDVGSKPRVAGLVIRIPVHASRVQP